MHLPVLTEGLDAQMEAAAMAARNDGDSIGGIIECMVSGLPAGLGAPFFGSVESQISHLMFSVPGIKGVEFGDGFGFASLRGSEANDAFRMDGEQVVTTTNHSGGVNGGITNAMPVIFRCAVRPTPTLSQSQNTVDMQTGENAELASKGRHDPCIVHRARIVADCVTALTLCDMLSGRFGADWLVEA